ncbi:MAG: GNAT family N-acetyltransferase [Alistipes sp.]|nr:GNAT family N-acetyltransferase [Alistipes sp.]
MVKKIILDLGEDHIRKKRDFIREMTKKYEITAGNPLSFGPVGTVVLTDKEDGSGRWADYAVIGIEYGDKINSVPYILEELEDLTDHDLRLAYGRKHRIPCVIASDDKIMLREASLKDIEALKRIYDDEDNVKYIPKMGGLEEEKEKMAAYIRCMYGYYGYGLWVIEDTVTGCLIGRAGIEHREIDGEDYYELAYLVKKEYRRKGYGYRAAQMALEFAKQYGMERVITYIHEKNIPSVRLSEKLGFTAWKETTDGTDKYIVSHRKL